MLLIFLVGYRLKGRDVFHAGIGTHYITSDKVHTLNTIHTCLYTITWSLCLIIRYHSSQHHYILYQHTTLIQSKMWSILIIVRYVYIHILTQVCMRSVDETIWINIILCALQYCYISMRPFILNWNTTFGNIVLYSRDKWLTWDIVFCCHKVCYIPNAYYVLSSLRIHLILISPFKTKC